MARKKGIFISLAAKCQLLFGLAVLVIIAGALAVPWQRMEQLAGQPNVKAARIAADNYFRQMHVDALANPLPTSTQPTTAPATMTAKDKNAEWNEITLFDAEYPAPRIYITTSPLSPLPVSVSSVDPLAMEALSDFRSHPQEQEHGTIGTGTDHNNLKTRIYRYAAAIRLDSSCLKCHPGYTQWVTGSPLPAAATQNGVLSAGTQKASTQPGVNIPPSLHTTLPATVLPDSPTPASADIATWPVVGVVRVDVPYQTDEDQLLLNRIVIVVAGMVGGTLAIVVFYLITSRLILQPVRVLKKTAEKVAMGDLNIRSAISTGDEFQQLSETFNTMLATLKASQDQLESSNRSLDTRVGELAQSNVDLFEANRLKSEFLTNVTHELRTPLNAIIGFADLMAETNRGTDARQTRYAENIRTSSRQLLDLINDLLDLAKIEAGKLVLREERVNVADVCEAMGNFMRPLAMKKDIEFVLSIAPDMPLITTDAGRFQQIVYNFLSNAIKFTPSNGTITITAKNEPAVEDKTSPGVRVSIADTGPGIAIEDQRVIFEKFRQIDGSVTRQHPGTGLGLTISKELAGMLGAKIELASVLGKGATFSLIMPREMGGGETQNAKLKTQNGGGGEGI